MAYENLKLGVSPLTKNVYAGRLNKQGTIWQQKVDITGQFLSCVLHYFDHGTENTITADGEPVARITIERLDGPQKNNEDGQNSH